VNPRKDPPTASAPQSAGETPVTPAPPATPVAPTSGDAPRAHRFVRHLPRTAMILFLLAILIVFRSVLLPFVLSVFFAFLIYPVVSRLERIPIGSWRPPRWLAVISVYIVLFVVGWWTIPPLFGNFAEQVGKLAQDVPTLFEKLGQQRKRVDAFVVRMLEVQSLSETARVGLFADVDALALGTLEPFVPPEGIELPPPTPPEQEKPAAPGAAAPAPPAVVQLIAINVDLGARGRPATPAGAARDGTPPAAVGAEALEPAGDGAPGPAPAVPGGDEGGAEPEPAGDGAPPRRFDDAQGRAMKSDLRNIIDVELEKPGPAKEVAARVEREIVPELVTKHLGLPVTDPQVQLFARNCGTRVAAAVQREEYVGTLNAYFVSAVDSARTFVQDELKKVGGLVTGLLAGLVRGIFDFFMVLMLTAFFLVFFPRIRDYMGTLMAPQYREDYTRVLQRIDVRLSGAIRGQVIICIVNAVLTFPGLWFIGRTTDATNLAGYAVLLSVLAGILSMIPIFGVILSTVPMVVLALAQGSVGGAVLVVGWICVIHAIEAYLLNPNILGHSASMNPIIVVFALLAGKQVYGLVGALLAVPVASVLVSLFGYYRRLIAEQQAAEQGGVAPADPWGD